MNKAWMRAALIRAAKTMGQSVAGAASSAAIFASSDLKTILTGAVLAAVYSLLTSLAGLPEVSEE